MKEHNPLQAWLDKNNAKHLWAAKTPTYDVDHFSNLTAWNVNGHVVIEVRYFSGKACLGWDVFCPATDSNKIEATLQALDNLCDVVPEKEETGGIEVKAKVQCDVCHNPKDCIQMDQSEGEYSPGRICQKCAEFMFEQARVVQSADTPASRTGS